MAQNTSRHQTTLIYPFVNKSIHFASSSQRSLLQKDSDAHRELEQEWVSGWGFLDTLILSPLMPHLVSHQSHILSNILSTKLYLFAACFLNLLGLRYPFLTPDFLTVILLHHFFFWMLLQIPLSFLLLLVHHPTSISNLFIWFFSPSLLHFFFTFYSFSLLYIPQSFTFLPACSLHG